MKCVLVMSMGKIGDDEALAEGVPCGRDATRSFIVGCQHEHVKTVHVCDQHANLSMLKQDTIFCRECAHWCRWMTTEVPFDEETL